MVGLLGGIQAGMQTALGLGQLISGIGMKPERPDSPTYKASESVGNRLSLSESLLNARSTAAKSGEANIKNSMGEQIKSVQSMARNPAQALSAITAVGANSEKAFNDLAAFESEDFLKRVRGLNQSYQAMAEEERKEFDINEMLPYEEQMREYTDQMAAKSRLAGGGISNINNAMSSGVNLAALLEGHGSIG